MRVEISPSLAKGSVSAPPSKSMAHRALICAALATGESRLSPISLSQDMLATMDALSALGAKFSRDGDAVTVTGMGMPKNQNMPLLCGESGSTLRFLLPLCLLTGEKMTLRGSSRLLERPLFVYEELCRSQGFFYEQKSDRVTVCGQLLPGEYKVPGNISSQFITGLLFALSMLSGESRLTVTGEMESASYLDMTLSAITAFGGNITRKGKTFLISPSSYESRNFSVEGDYSNAAFLEAFDLVGGFVSLSGLEETSLQGDRVYRNHFPLLKNGCPEIDLSDCPDLGPILIALAAFFNGARFKGTGRLRIKESDRGAAMAEEIAKCGGEVTVLEDEIIVQKKPLFSPKKEISGHNDHRIAMAMAVLLSRIGGVLEGAESVNKSFPEFFEIIEKLGIEVKKQ